MLQYHEHSPWDFPKIYVETGPSNQHSISSEGAQGSIIGPYDEVTASEVSRGTSLRLVRVSDVEYCGITLKDGEI